MSDNTPPFFVYENSETFSTTVPSCATLDAAIAQALEAFPDGEWVIKDITRTLVARWNGSSP